MANINIYLTNSRKYNEGELFGEWLELPTSDEELKAALDRVCGTACGTHDECFITDYECDFDYKVGEYDNIFELNELLADLEDVDNDVVEALLYFGYDLDEIADKADDVYIYCDCRDMEDVAIAYCEECGVLNSVPEHLQNYFDFEAFGRDMSFEGNYYFTDGGDCIALLY